MPEVITNLTDNLPDGSLQAAYMAGPLVGIRVEGVFGKKAKAPK